MGKVYFGYVLTRSNNLVLASLGGRRKVLSKHEDEFVRSLTFNLSAKPKLCRVRELNLWN